MRNRIETRTSALPFYLLILNPRMSRENSPNSPTSFLASLPTSTLFLSLDSAPLALPRLNLVNVLRRGVLPIAMALDRQGRCETNRDTNRDTRRKLFCICTCSYTSASSPENDDSIHCFRKSSSRQVRCSFTVLCVISCDARFPTSTLFLVMMRYFVRIRREHGIFLKRETGYDFEMHLKTKGEISVNYSLTKKTLGSRPQFLFKSILCFHWSVSSYEPFTGRGQFQILKFFKL